MNIQKYLQLKIKLTDLEGADLTQHCELNTKPANKLDTWLEGSSYVVVTLFGWHCMQDSILVLPVIRRLKHRQLLHLDRRMRMKRMEIFWTWLRLTKSDVGFWLLWNFLNNFQTRTLSGFRMTYAARQWIPSASNFYPTITSGRTLRRRFPK